jgi:hypothetical protein
MSVVAIVPVEIPQSPIVETSVRVIVLSVSLGVSASIQAQLINADGAVVEVKSLLLEQPEYSFWGSDDEFVVNWTLLKLGLTKAPVAPVVPVVPVISEVEEIKSEE